ncbi:MAG: methyltransferase domain-containing protein [Alphaproteobacteria bacterium]|nr:methyltransferase domain-containing protein [Alphaproteobacteria bacterium]
MRKAVRASVSATCAYYVVDDWRVRQQLRRGDIATTSGARHYKSPLADSLAYIERVHEDYLAYAGRDAFAGTVAEVGPGDNFGVALLLLAGGAHEVHAIDRYRSRRDAAHQTAIYQALAARHDLGHLFADGYKEQALSSLSYHTGRPAERFFREHDGCYDAILSRAVMEHLYDPLGALDDMAAALAPRGVLVHRIDMRDHGMFAGRHPLTFLTLSDRLHRAMTCASGRPNRVLLPQWRAWLGRSGLEGSLRITRLVGVAKEIAPVAWGEIDPALREAALASVAEIRPKLTPAIAALANEDLAVAGCVLVAAKA